MEPAGELALRHTNLQAGSAKRLDDYLIRAREDRLRHAPLSYMPLFHMTLFHTGRLTLMSTQDSEPTEQNERLSNARPSFSTTQSRAAQTRIIGALALSVVALVVWQDRNRDFSSMAPTARCEYAAYRYKHGWDNELQCKASAAGAALSGQAFSDDNPYR